MRTIEDKIKAEIERRIAACKSTDGRILPPRTRHAICFDELTDLLAFIKSLEKEPKPYICPHCTYYMHDECYFPHGGLSYLINENGVCECNGFNEIEKNG